MSLPTLRQRRRFLGLLIALSMFATACGGATDVLQGDTATHDGAAPSSQGAAPTRTAPSPTAPSAAQDGGDDAVEVDVVADEPADEPAGDPEVVVLTAANGGAVDTFADTQFTVRASQSTNSDIGDFIRSGPRLDCCDRYAVVVNLTVENLIQRFYSTSRTGVILQSPTGQEFVADNIYGVLGLTQGITFNGRDAADLRVTFETPELIEDLSDWHLIIRRIYQDDNRLPLVLPLEGPAYARNYPLALADGSTGTFEKESARSCIFGTVVERVDVALDEAGQWKDNLASRDSSLRVAPGERLVAIELAITGLADPDEFDGCETSLLWPDFVLQVDGFDVTPRRTELQDVEPLATSTSRLVFEIPADAQKVNLLGGDDRSTLASWNLDLPLEAGEAGAPLVADQSRLATEVQQAAGPRPDELTSQTLTDGGATGVILGAQVAVRTTTATNADATSFINGQPTRDSLDRTYVVADVEVTGNEDTLWSLWDHHFVLIDPSGRPHVGIDLFEADGEEIATADVDGKQQKLIRVLFETNGLVLDPTGWMITIVNGEDIPLVLPLVGETTSDFPRGLTSGQTATISYDPGGCDESFDATITSARVDLEGPQRGDGISTLNIARMDPERRSVVVDLELTNPGGVGVDSITCISLTYWPEFLLEVDGRTVAPFLYGWPTIEPGTTLTLPLHYEIPKDAQTATLTFDDQVLATWQLKDADQVLTDLGAQDIDSRTLVTLDETLLFAFGESTLQQGALGPLNRLASVVNSESSGEIEIIGHTDSIGDDDSNAALSLARAEAVAAALVDAGVDQSRLVISGRGEAEPVAPNETDAGIDNPAGRAENRRVEILFSTEG